MTRILVIASLGVALAGCVSSAPAERFAYLRVIAQPDTTTVYIEGRFIGTARLLEKQPKVLRPGVKYLTFKAPGHFPHDVKLDLPAGETTARIKLRPIPP